MQNKTDAQQIEGFLKNLAREDWIRRTERRWWPHFLFHYTDIQNAVKVLESEHLYSRNYLEKQGHLVVSSGSPTVLAHTNTVVKDCVRLYFRPKTPTQYHAEGIHSKSSLSSSRFPQAHCPVPIFFLFDANSLLTRQDCWFSDGNLSSPHAQIFSSATELEHLPWKKIYHTGFFNRSNMNESDIVFHRHAEAVIPRQVDLSALRYIYCRSDAERETLLHLLSPSSHANYMGKIVATSRSDLYFRRQTYIESVRLTSDFAIIQFSPDTFSKGPFYLQIRLIIAGSTRKLEKKVFNIPQNYILKVPISSDFYSIEILLDDYLSYSNSFEKYEIPF